MPNFADQAVATAPPPRRQVAAPRAVDQSTGIARGAGDDDNRGQFLSVEKLAKQYTAFLGAKIEEVEESKQSRRYYHGVQWTAEEIKIFRARRQPIVTFNSCDGKINAVVGLIERLRQDPKAFPSNPRHEQGAEVATATIRYVLDANDWKTLSSEVARHASIDGYSGVELKLRKGDKGDPDVKVGLVFGDDFFYDARSRMPDFHDCRYMGIARWLDEEEAVDLFPDKEEEVRNLTDLGTDRTTYADSEIKWAIVNERRIRLVEHWYKHRGKWHWAFYIGYELLDEGVSPFLDERGNTIPRFIMFSAHVDQDSDRYGFIRNLKGPQDEKNQRRAKALFTANSRRLIADKGAVDDVETARREWGRPDGYVEKNPGLNITADDTGPDMSAQLGFLQDAKQEIDRRAPATPVMPGSEQMAPNTSGRAINLLQQAGTAELGPFIIAYRGWKIRVYRAIWSLCQRYWTAERWIRVTDDQKLAQFLQLNGLDLDEWGRPMLVNALGQLDVDIGLDEGPDVVNMMADAYEHIKDDPNVPWQVKIELSSLAGSVKERILAMGQKPPDPIEQAGRALTVKRIQSDIDEKDANALMREAKAAEATAKAGLNAAQVLQHGLEMSAAIQGQPEGSPTPAQPQGPVAPPQGVGPPQMAPGGQLALPFAKFLAPQPQQGSPT